MRGVIYIQCEGRFDLAADLLQRNRELLDRPFFRSYVAYALAGARRFKDALVLLEPIEPTSGQDAFSVQGCLLWRLALQGKKEKVREVISSEYVATCRRDPGYSIIVADFYALLDDREQTLDWLENAVNRGYINYPYLSEYDPFLSKLRSDPRFRKLMVRVKGEWERFEI
jgi:non-specific serine/threonine protein kinase